VRRNVKRASNIKTQKKDGKTEKQKKNQNKNKRLKNCKINKTLGVSDDRQSKIKIRKPLEYVSLYINIKNKLCGKLQNQNQTDST